MMEAFLIAFPLQFYLLSCLRKAAIILLFGLLIWGQLFSVFVKTSVRSGSL